MSWFVFIKLILRVLIPFRTLRTEWIAESKRFEFFGGIPSKYFSLLCARRLFMNVYNDFHIKSQIAKWWNKRLFQATCIHPNSSYISDTRSISLQTICHDDIGNWWVLIDPRKGWCPQQHNSFVGWNVVISTTTINIREGVLKLWHDGVRYKGRSQPGTKMIRFVCCGGSNP